MTSPGAWTTEHLMSCPSGASAGGQMDFRCSWDGLHPGSAGLPMGFRHATFYPLPMPGRAMWPSILNLRSFGVVRTWPDRYFDSYRRRQSLFERLRQTLAARQGNNHAQEGSWDAAKVLCRLVSFSLDGRSLEEPGCRRWGPPNQGAAAPRVPFAHRTE